MTTIAIYLDVLEANYFLGLILLTTLKSKLTELVLDITTE